MKIVICNVGSTSLKYKLYDMGDERILARGKVDGVGGDAAFEQTVDGGKAVSGRKSLPDQESAVRFMIETLPVPMHAMDAIGFKVVGADGVTGAVRLDETVLAAMRAHNPLLPRHNPPYIAAIEIFAAVAPDVPLIGLFETDFHRDIPPEAYLYGVPYEWHERHSVRRYGYHGASLRYVTERTAEILGRTPARMIACHLGGSSSICAIKDGRSVDTSMGMSAQAGISMSNRCGDVDPFVIPFVMDRESLSTDEVRNVLTSRSGLLGLSGISGDVRLLEVAAAEGRPRADLALKVFAYEVRKYIGAYAAVLGGLDVLVFTGGIGENGAAMRRRICENLGFLGIQLSTTNEAVAGVEAAISPADARVPVLVVPTDEEIIVARACQRVLEGG